MYSRYVKLRDKKGVRDADVASATRIGKSTFTDWKQGRSVPKQEKLQRIADYFEVNIGYFTDEKQFLWRSIIKTIVPHRIKPLSRTIVCDVEFL